MWTCSICGRENNDSSAKCIDCGSGKNISANINDDLKEEKINNYSKIINKFLEKDRYDTILEVIGEAKNAGINENDLPITVKQVEYSKENIKKIKILKKDNNFSELSKLLAKLYSINSHSKYITLEKNKYEKFYKDYTKIDKEKDIKKLFKKIKDVKKKLHSHNKCYRIQLEDIIEKKIFSIEKERKRLNTLKESTLKSKRYSDSLNTIKDISEITDNTSLYIERYKTLKEAIPFLNGEILRDINKKKNITLCNKKSKEIEDLIIKADPLFKNELERINELIINKKKQLINVRLIKKKNLFWAIPILSIIITIAMFYLLPQLDPIKLAKYVQTEFINSLIVKILGTISIIVVFFYTDDDSISIGCLIPLFMTLFFAFLLKFFGYVIFGIVFVVIELTGTIYGHTLLNVLALLVLYYYLLKKKSNYIEIKKIFPFTIVFMYSALILNIILIAGLFYFINGSQAEHKKNQGIEKNIKVVNIPIKKRSSTSIHKNNKKKSFWNFTKKEIISFFKYKSDWKFKIIPEKNNKNNDKNFSNILGKIFTQKNKSYLIRTVLLKNKPVMVGFGDNFKDDFKLFKNSTNIFELNFIKKIINNENISYDDFEILKNKTVIIKNGLKIDIVQKRYINNDIEIIMFSAEIEELKKSIFLILNNKYIKSLKNHKDFDFIFNERISELYNQLEEQIQNHKDSLLKQYYNYKLESESTLIKAALEYENQGPVKRFAHCDYAFGKDIKEFSELKGVGVIKIISLNKDENEYPIKRVYFQNDNSQINLELLYSNKVQINKEKTKNVFGTNRMDFYYLIPFHITNETGKLFIDWSKNKKGFEILNFPINNPSVESFINQKIQDSSENININTLKAFLEREFGLVLNLYEIKISKIYKNKEKNDITDNEEKKDEKENELILALTEQIDENPENDSLYFRRGVVFLEDKKFDSAIVDFSKAININNKKAIYYEYRGKTYFYLKSYEIAVANFTKAINLYPNSSKFYILRGNMYNLLKKYNLAIDDFDRALKFNKRNIKAYVNRAFSYIKKKKYKKAIKDIKKAIKLKPNYADLYYKLSCYYSLKGKKKKAIKSLEQAIYKGFSDKHKIMYEKAFELIKKDIRFKNILKKL